MNGFLAALDNDSSAPINGSSTTGNIPWPSPFKVQVYAPWEVELRTRLYGESPTRFIHFTRSIQLLWLVQNSVLSDIITRTDPLITYGDQQLSGQFNGISMTYRDTVALALAQIPNMEVTNLPDVYLTAWNTALSKADKLAAVVAYFGAKYAV